MFTVYLGVYGYGLNFDQEVFTKTYPESVITLALQSGEETITLTNPIVTPEILQLLKSYMKTQNYPWIDEKSKDAFIRAIDYLSIDPFPEFMYSPEYKRYTQGTGKWINALTVDTEYTQLITTYPELAAGICQWTDKDVHREEDTKIFDRILQEDPSVVNEQVGLALMECHHFRSQNGNVTGLLINHGYVEMLKLHGTVELHTNHYRAILGIHMHPDRYAKYVAILAYLRSLREMDLYHMKIFDNVTEGKNEDLSMGLLFTRRNLIPSLLYVSLFHNRPETFRILYAVGRSIHIDIINEFIDSLFKHPQVITLEMCRIVSPILTREQRARLPHSVPGIVERCMSKLQDWIMRINITPPHKWAAQSFTILGWIVLAS